MKLFLVHCGFYDPEVGDGVYEGHTNFFVVAHDFAEARVKVKQNEKFALKKMHVDGLQQIEIVDGFRIELAHDEALQGKSEVISSRFRDLAPKPSPAAPL